MEHPHLPRAQGADAAGHLPDAVRHPPWLLWAASGLAIATAIVALVGWIIDRGHAFAFDRSILLAMRRTGDMPHPIGPAWLEGLMIDITTLGGGLTLTLIVVLTVSFLAIRRLWLTAGLVVTATVLGSLVIHIAKEVIARPRPQVVDHLVHVSSLSFPSGHSANSAIVYLTIATLLVQIVDTRAARNFILITAGLLVAAIGCSRVYLGVHWPTDVLAGWSFGIFWALGWWALGAWIRIRRSVD
ncbi:phosphatase PAP2 family protein [Hephaestia sp. GCM10023244]|uniref:phosphatase PAP2 family protein n=1 Tax=unclassified Hephaestia TaxID=2631281 RepID=UPI0020776429|nr:phosphatase PAP2 family protein [Hephaestia sp. MAHUQ-44]MCM8730454.1 phosphatase PAP2 family protein [Hephaestia sp. MAHUQ-44]